MLSFQDKFYKNEITFALYFIFGVFFFLGERGFCACHREIVKFNKKVMPQNALQLESQKTLQME